MNVTYLDMDPGSEYHFIADWNAQKSDSTTDDCRAYLVGNGTDLASKTLVLQKDCDSVPWCLVKTRACLKVPVIFTFQF